MTPFLSWILPMLSQFYVQDRYLSCPRTILGSSFHTQEASDTKKNISTAKFLTNTQHMELEPLCSGLAITMTNLMFRICSFIQKNISTSLGVCSSTIYTKFNVQIGAGGHLKGFGQASLVKKVYMLRQRQCQPSQKQLYFCFSKSKE